MCEGRYWQGEGRVPGGDGGETPKGPITGAVPFRWIIFRVPPTGPFFQWILSGRRGNSQKKTKGHSRMKGFRGDPGTPLSRKTRA